MTTNTQTETQQQASSGHQAAAGHAEKTNLNTTPSILESDLTKKRMQMLGSSFVCVCQDLALGFEVFERMDQEAPAVVQKFFSGRRMKADGFYKFPNRKAADFYKERRLRQLAEIAAAKAKHKLQNERPLDIAVGDVLVSIWGFEQTNVDYYQVTALVGKKSIRFRKIRAALTSTSDMTGTCVPLLGDFSGPPITKQVNSFGSVQLNSYCSASKKEKTLVDGVLTYSPNAWTAYA